MPPLYSVYGVYIYIYTNFHVVLNATIIQCIWCLASSLAVLRGHRSLLVHMGSFHFANNQRAHLLDVPSSNVLMDVFLCFVCYYKGWCSEHPSSDIKYLLVQMLL